MRKIIVAFLCTTNLFYATYASKSDVPGVYRKAKYDKLLADLHKFLADLSQAKGIPLGLGALASKKAAEKLGVSSELSDFTALTLTAIGYYFFVPNKNLSVDVPLACLTIGTLQNSQKKASQSKS